MVHVVRSTPHFSLDLPEWTFRPVNHRMFVWPVFSGFLPAANDPLTPWSRGRRRVVINL